ncbi:uncharacterized protein LOC8268352 [Ricinus communis]|uniref:uncharacterized protein LOC8268352 n=1 Tax=Ricinus communis TaxID=3988 RepID=UPI00201B2417|nr:uncharacterized protein LOC8268352 [Ricinus communis]XP_015571699.2 uncharacterized protein LOC8268352 [Ricinus communis]XP_015571700.2 uncharacterized protein LOC8268352 [Ricinus communis]XP_025012231.2 uncharacterized protein LOC8268352 [Ricinus communis]
MYRSFVTCDDPKGVVECGTIRKSKSVSQKIEEDKIKTHRTRKNSNTSLAHKGKKEEMVPKGNAEDNHSPSSFQLLEVSRGAQKLNHLIDSWSKGLNYDGQSKDIAKDLLKGALDLQESLTMLSKLQEASQYMAHLKKKQKEKVERGRIDEVGSERMNSHLFGDHNQQQGFQNPRLSADGSSRDCIEELRNAIRDGLARQNLLSNTSRQEKFDKRKMDSISHFLSTSSSQLSVVHSDHNHSTASSSSQTALPKKEKTSNLIAKLMGLEDIPSKAMLQSPQKQLEMEKNMSPQRPVFDIDMPRLRNPQSIIQKVDSEQRTLKEILETVQFQGLLKGSSTKERKFQSHQSSNFQNQQRFIDDITPIVLIKPMRVSQSVSEEASPPMVWEQGALSRKMMLRKMRMKEELVPRSIDEKRVTSNSSKRNCRTEAEKPPIERVIQEGAKDHIEEVMIPEEKEIKEVRTIHQKEAAVNVNRVNRKLKAEKALVKRHVHEEGIKDCKDIVQRTEEKEVRKKLKNSSKMGVSNPATHQQQKNETTDTKVDKAQKVDANSRKPVEKETARTKNVSRDQEKLTSTRPRKPDIGSITTNDHILQQCTSTRKNISKHVTQSIIHNSKNRKPKDKQARNHTSVKPITDNLESKEDEKRIDISCNNHSQKKESTTTVVDLLSVTEEANASEFLTAEHCDDSKSSLCIDIMPASVCEKTSKSCKEADDHMTQIRTESSIFKTGNQLKDLLSTSPSFLNLAEDAFHLNMSYPKIIPTYGIYNGGDIDVKLSLDYANEYIERRSLPDSKTRHPLLSCMENSRFHICLDQLVEEVCSGVETLKSFHKLACDELHADSLYATLERDMMCKGVVNGIWDLGWRSGCSSEEVEQTVNDLEKSLVSELIWEVFS